MTERGEPLYKTRPTGPEAARFGVDIRSRGCTHVGPVLRQLEILAGVVREDHVVGCDQTRLAVLVHHLLDLAGVRVVLDPRHVIAHGERPGALIFVGLPTGRQRRPNV